MLIWRPVVAGFGKLKEVQHDWSIYDCLDACDVLDYQSECQAVAQRAANNASMKGRGGL